MDQSSQSTTTPPQANTTPASQHVEHHGMSDDSKTLVTVLLLFFAYPVGLILMWVWTKWKLWIKILITLPVPLLLISIPLFTILLVAINPAGKFAEAKNAARISDTNSILNAIVQYQAEKGVYPSALTNMPKEIGSEGADLCKDLVPSYMASLPVDPSQFETESVTNCSAPYSTLYEASLNDDGTVTVSAPQAELDESISATR